MRLEDLHTSELVEADSECGTVRFAGWESSLTRRSSRDKPVTIRGHESGGQSNLIIR